MPYTPLIGLSVLVHVGVIIIYRIFGQRKGVAVRAHKLVQKLSHATRIVSMSIMASIFMVIFTSAVMLMDRVITEKHSSVYLVENIVKDFTPNVTNVNHSNH